MLAGFGAHVAMKTPVSPDLANDKGHGKAGRAGQGDSGIWCPSENGESFKARCNNND